MFSVDCPAVGYAPALRRLWRGSLQRGQGCQDLEWGRGWGGVGWWGGVRWWGQGACGPAQTAPSGWLPYTPKASAD